jgi:hypothetical protein
MIHERFGLDCFSGHETAFRVPALACVIRLYYGEDVPLNGCVANSRIRRIRALGLGVSGSPDCHGRSVQTTDFELCSTSGS